jgi:hypothetical protein
LGFVVSTVQRGSGEAKVCEWYLSWYVVYDPKKVPHIGITTGGTLALTDTEIKKAKPGDKPYKMADGGRLYLLVNPSGGETLALGI